MEVFDVSTAQDDARGRWCMKPLSPWISGASRAILHLYSTSLEHLPEFEIIGNVYIKGKENYISVKSGANVAHRCRIYQTFC